MATPLEILILGELAIILSATAPSTKWRAWHFLSTSKGAAGGWRRNDIRDSLVMAN